MISQIWEATTANRMKIDLYCQQCIDYVDILLGVPALGGLQSQCSERKWRFSSFMSQYLGNGTRYVQRYYYRNLHMRFRLAARSMTLDDLELLYFWIFSEFRVISQIWEATTAKRMTIDLSAMHRLRWYIAGRSSARGSTITIPWVKMAIFNLYTRKYLAIRKP